MSSATLQFRDPATENSVLSSVVEDFEQDDDLSSLGLFDCTAPLFQRLQELDRLTLAFLTDRLLHSKLAKIKKALSC